MQFEKLTIKTQEALSRAQVIASENGHQSIEDIHLMAALLEQKDGVIIPILAKLEINIDEFISMQVSSRKTPKQRGILELLKRLEPGDVLLVSELSRLGRSVGQIIQMIDDLVTNRIRFVAIKENIELSGKQDIQTKVMVTMFSLFAEIERYLISERTKEGIKAVRVSRLVFFH